MWLARFGSTLLALVGTLSLWGALRPAVRARAAQDWRPTECRVYDRHLIDPHLRPERPYARLTYTYLVDGQWHDGNDASLLGDNASRVDLDEVAVGARLPCLYDPDAPEHAVLVRVGWSLASWDLVTLGVILLGHGSLALQATAGPRAAAASLAVGAGSIAALAWTIPGVGGSWIEALVLSAIAVAAIARIAHLFRHLKREQ